MEEKKRNHPPSNEDPLQSPRPSSSFRHDDVDHLLLLSPTTFLNQTLAIPTTKATMSTTTTDGLSPTSYLNSILKVDTDIQGNQNPKLPIVPSLLKVDPVQEDNILQELIQATENNNTTIIHENSNQSDIDEITATTRRIPPPTSETNRIQTENNHDICIHPDDDNWDTKNTTVHNDSHDQDFTLASLQQQLQPTTLATTVTEQVNNERNEMDKHSQTGADKGEGCAVEEISQSVPIDETETNNNNSNDKIGSSNTQNLSSHDMLPPNDVTQMDEDAVDDHLVISPLTPRQIHSLSLQRTNLNDVFRSKDLQPPPFNQNTIPSSQGSINDQPNNNNKSKSLQVEFPSPLETNAAYYINNNLAWQRKGNDVVSLSSASSTISYGSTAYARGLLGGNNSIGGGGGGGMGVLSPSTTDDTSQQQLQQQLLLSRRNDPNHPTNYKNNNSHNNALILETAKPPRFPKKAGTKELLESPRSFVDSLSKRLIIAQEYSEGSGSEEFGSDGGVETRWIKQAKSSSSAFNPKWSIFASKTSSDFPDMSPPGSPPEPVYSTYDDEERSTTSRFYSPEGDDSSSAIFSSASNPEAATWDMISEMPAREMWFGRADDERCTTKASSFVVMPEPGTPTRNLSAEAPDVATAFLFTRSGRKSLTTATYPSRISGKVALSNPSHRANRGVVPFPNQRYGEGIIPDGQTDHAFSDSISLSERPSPKDPKAQESSPLASSKQHQSSPDLRRLHEEGSLRNASVVKDAHPDAFFKVEGEAAMGGIAALSGKDLKESAIALPNDTSQQFSCVEEEMLEARRKGTVLNEELVAFSSFRHFDIPFRYDHPCAALKYLACVKWKQLVSYWKHSEMVRSMMVQLTEQRRSSRTADDLERDEWSSAHDCFRKTVIQDLNLNGISLQSSSKVQTTFSSKDVNFLQRAQISTSSLSRFLSEIVNSQAASKICHDITEVTSSGPLEKLLELARSEQNAFQLIVAEIAAFASNSIPPRFTNGNSGSVRYSVCTKHPKAVELKAKRKYGGDILQVKDILRAQIMFPDEKSLVCGLVRLSQMEKSCEELSASGDSSPTTCVKFRLVRIKNLFAKESILDGELVTPLPSGYRHVLLNIQLASGLLAEIQCNFSSLFDVLGDEGYSFHMELCALRRACDERTKRHGKDLDIRIKEILEGANSDSSIWEQVTSAPLIHVTSNLPTTITPTSSYECTALGNDDTPQVRNKYAEKSKHNTAGGIIPSAMGTNSLDEKDGFQSIGEDKKVPDDMGSTSQSSPYEPYVATENRTSELEELITYPGNISAGDIALFMLENGARAADKNPRDVSTFYCLYVLFSFLAKHGNEAARFLGFGVQCTQDLVEYAQRCLVRCLKISNQAQCIGMMGWLEYGRSCPLDRVEDRPFRILSHLASDFARQGQWSDAESVLSSLFIRCEDNLPSYHPLTLSTMLDLAIAATMVGSTRYAEKLVFQSANRLSKFLAAIEGMHFSHIAASKSIGKKEGFTFRIENDRDSLFHLHSFVSLFQEQLKRDLITLVDPDSDVVLTNQCLFADSLAVLANNYAASKTAFGLSQPGNVDYGLQYWQQAYVHYSKCFLVFAERKGFDSPNTAKAAYGLARCLREFEETETALELLALVVSASGPPKEPTRGHCIQDEIYQDERFTPRFLPSRRPPQTIAMHCAAPYKCISTALCLWLMAVLSLDSSPNEKGRERAFSYLHAASVSLQTALKVEDSGDEWGIRETCIQYLAMIEEEAILISDPLYT